ncbi:MAG: DedA family protein [Candidatus Magasanikbacteria bacterium]|nr:DedA family protein [Candidatus Magasanikbacteria bacterium]
MFTFFLEFLGRMIVAVINALGYGGVVLTMAIESACVPLPSEIIMPFAGFLARTGRFNLWLLGFLGALGNLFGSWAAYAVGRYGGRPFLERYGKFIFLSRRDLDWADHWFVKHGEGTVFFSRLLPVIRTFISLPAGIAKMNFWKFSLFSLAGSLPWSLFLAYLGFRLGNRWQDLKFYFHRFDLLVGIILAAALFWFFRRHFKKYD